MEIKNNLLQTRPRNHLDRQKKPGCSFNVSLDLTKRHYNLLIKTKGLIANNPSVAYAFFNINCSFVLKFNDNTCHYFSSETELNSLLNPELLRKMPDYPDVVLINHW